MKVNDPKVIIGVPIAVAIISALATVLAAQIGVMHIRDSAQLEGQRVASQKAILGEVRIFAFEQPPPGWKECAGQSLDRHKYNALYKVIGKQWGADDSGSFSLPDFRGMFLRGWNDAKFQNNRDISPEAEKFEWWDKTASQRHQLLVNGFSGDHVGSYQEDEVGPHSHYVANGVGIDQTNNRGSFEYTSNPGFGNAHKTDPAEDLKKGLAKDETVPKNASVMYAIYVGDEQ